MLGPVDLGLFDTLVPIASITTITFLVVFILPRQESLGLFLLLWRALSVFISLSGSLFSNPSEWTAHDSNGMLAVIGIPSLVLARLYAWYRTRPSIRLFLYKHVKLWMLFALHIYRLDGLSIILPFWKGEIPKYLGLQMILLDVIIGATSIPLTWLLYTQGAEPITVGWRRDFVWFWNSVGLYDLGSAYVVLILNYFGLGGSLVTEPPLSVVGFHPIPLIVLFQAPLAIAIHIFLLTCMNDIVEEQSGGLPLRVQRLRRQH